MTKISFGERLMAPHRKMEGGISASCIKSPPSSIHALLFFFFNFINASSGGICQLLDILLQRASHRPSLTTPSSSAI
ncbi:unnamed protein product [Lactuca virosa]|uniref:Uncharacterized protein n=1 Tax=Lactuca virosa TaxID=75947 RepID=A0AAU9MD25_9ASTR|nr:unnamed protein product [Lactuca virosa]